MPEKPSKKPAAARNPAAARKRVGKPAPPVEAKAEPDQSPTRAPTRPLSLSPSVLGAALAIVAALAVALVISYLHQADADSLDQARSQALAAAQGYAVEVASYDYRTLDHDFGIVNSHSTGQFKQQFSKASGAIKPLIVQYKGTAKASVLSAGVVRASKDSVTVVMFVDQTVTNSNATTPRVDRNRVSMTLIRHGGQWLIEKVELL